MAELNTLQDFLNFVASDAFDVTSPRDGAVFYSGVSPDLMQFISDEAIRHNGQLAAIMTNLGPFVQLEATPGGRFLVAQDLYSAESPLSEREAQQVWAAASEKYARSAAGRVIAHVGAAPEGRVFRSVELPALLGNPDVVSINSIERSTLLALCPSFPREIVPAEMSAVFERIEPPLLQRMHPEPRELFPRSPDFEAADRLFAPKPDLDGFTPECDLHDPDVTPGSRAREKDLVPV